MRFDDIRWNELEPVETPLHRGKGEKKAPIMGAVGGSGEIRTHGRLTPSPVFKTGALNHSATLPRY
jgi:hypothetical protein